MCRGGGKAWLKDQEDIYHHAKGLGIIDVPHPWGDDRKQGTEDDLTKSQWSNFTDRLNAAKAKATADGTQHFVLGSTDEQNQRSSDWYQTPEGAAYAASIGKPVGFGIRGGGGDSGGESGSGLLTNPGTGIGPYPLYNMYFPQLTHAYEAPQAQDWSQYGLLDPNYQPWSVQGGQQFVPENIWNYAPPQINRQPVQYAGPPMGGLMEVIMPAEESKSTTNPNDDLENRGGKGLEQYGDLAGLGTWQGDKFADIHGNVWDGNDFDTDTELAAMVSYGNPNATKAFNDWQGWDTKPGQTVGLFGAASGEDDNSSSEFGPASHMI